jgi:hypothetical protein
MNNFAVFHVKHTDTDVLKRMGAGNSLYGGNLKTLQAIVFEDKASINNLGKNSIYLLDQNFPHAYKVVRDPNGGSLKFTGSILDGFATNASDTDKPVPSLEPDDWSAAGNSKTNPPLRDWDLEVPSSEKWDVNDFNPISMVRDTGIRLADAVLSRLFGRSMG